MQWVLNEVQRKLGRVRKLTPTNSLRFCLQLVLAESGKAINPPDRHTILHPLRIARDPAFDVLYGINPKLDLPLRVLWAVQEIVFKRRSTFNIHSVVHLVLESRTVP